MRKDARTNAFKLIFEGLFHECDEKLSIEALEQLKKDEDIKFFDEIMLAFNQNKDELKKNIEENLKNFEYDRLFKIDLAIIYLALTEIKFCGTPKAVAINEALEIAKVYSTEKSHKFINGLISAIINEK
ncbi:MAG: transcription antitermination factor NusB [Clostridia bacterium]|nr:transcription antitermination factor NusB [Clostridia bacterium]